MTETAAEPAVVTPDALAAWYAGAHREDLRYVAAWKRWMAWDGRRWRPDTTLLATDLARAVCGRAAAMLDERTDKAAKRARRRLGGAALPASIERLARCDRALAAEPGQWDPDPTLLNTPSGILDTRTGEMLPHRPEACLTRITAVAPAAPGTAHPLWSRFLDRVTGGDAGLAFYLQRVAGYALAGSGSEHAVFFLVGSGANGKSTFLGTLARALGDYAGVVPADGLTGPASRLGAAVARLDGRRLVAVEDASDGGGWSAARLKALCGGDPAPRATLLVAANDWPALGRVDAAVARRLHLIPFTAVIPEVERDPHLPEKLEAERSAILRWAIDGALAWRRMGLRPPASLVAARDAHLDAEDTPGQWLADCTDPAPGSWASSAALFGSWRNWCREAGEKSGSRKRFALMLAARGVLPKRRRTGCRGFVGLSLRDPSAAMRDTLAEMLAERVVNASSRHPWPAVESDEPQPDAPGASIETPACEDASSGVIGTVDPPPIRRAGRAIERQEVNASSAFAKASADRSRLRASVVPAAQWRRMIRRHSWSPADGALLFSSPVLAALVNRAPPAPLLIGLPAWTNSLPPNAAALPLRRHREEPFLHLSKKTRRDEAVGEYAGASR